MNRRAERKLVALFTAAPDVEWYALTLMDVTGLYSVSLYPALAGLKERGVICSGSDADGRVWYSSESSRPVSDVYEDPRAAVVARCDYESWMNNEDRAVPWDRTVPWDELIAFDQDRS